MELLRSASFGTLFAVTFAVAATFQGVMALAGGVLAVMAPRIFHMNGAPAADPVQALAVVLFMLIFGLAANAAISAGGAGLWLVVRLVLFRGAKAA